MLTQMNSGSRARRMAIFALHVCTQRSMENNRGVLSKTRSMARSCWADFLLHWITQCFKSPGPSGPLKLCMLTTQQQLQQLQRLYGLTNNGVKLHIQHTRKVNLRIVKHKSCNSQRIDVTGNTKALLSLSEAGLPRSSSDCLNTVSAPCSSSCTPRRSSSTPQ